MPTEQRSVLFVITRGDSIGGAQIHVRDLAEGAQKKGRRVAVAVGTPGPFLSMLEEAGVEAFLVPGLARSINPWGDLRAIFLLKALVKRWKPDVVACHTAKAGLVGRVAAWLGHVPSQYTVHGWQFAAGISRFQRFPVLLAEKLLARITQTVITVSDFDRNLALQHRLIPEDRVVTIHNGMPLSDSPHAFRGGSTVRLIMVARFQPQKDHATLFAALQKLEALPWSLHLVGDGPDQSRWQEWVVDRGWGERVTFHGLSLEVATLLAQSDLFVLASRWEGFPNSILEAMRAGLPVIASDVGGVREAVEEGRTGRIVPPGNPAALATALAELLADRSLRQAWGFSGRKRFEESFTFQTMLEKTEAVWDRE